MSNQREQSHVICALHDLSDPGAREFSVGEGDWPLRGFVVRYRGELRAYLNSCPHAGLPLNFRPNEFFAPHAELLQCTAHGALFEPLSGECVAGPCVGQNLRTLEVAIEDDQVWLRGSLDMLESYWT